MDDVFALWRTWHKNKGHIPNLLTEKQELDEISYDSVDKVASYMDPNQLKPYLPFNKLFGGKMRVEIPLEGETEETELMNDIISSFKNNGWTIKNTFSFAWF